MSRFWALSLRLFWCHWICPCGFWGGSFFLVLRLWQTILDCWHRYTKGSHGFRGKFTHSLRPKLKPLKPWQVWDSLHFTNRTSKSRRIPRGISEADHTLKSTRTVRFSINLPPVAVGGRSLKTLQIWRLAFLVVGVSYNLINPNNNNDLWRSLRTRYYGVHHVDPYYYSNVYLLKFLNNNPKK